MGTYRIEVQAAGGHGCQREIADGSKVYGCNKMGCPDCEARRFVELLKSQGQNIESATLTHWPGQESQVIDDLVTKIRHGNF